MSTPKTFEYIESFAALATLKRNLQAAKADQKNAISKKAKEGEIYSKLMAVMAIETSIRQVEGRISRLEGEAIQELGLLNRQKGVHDFSIVHPINGIVYTATLSPEKKLAVASTAN